MTYDIHNLVFEGGGVRGIAYIGALKVLEEKGILSGIQRIGGTSAGAINALFLGLGFTADEMNSKLELFDLKKIQDGSWGVIPNVYRLAKKFGWYKGDYILENIKEIIRQKTEDGESTFEDIENMPKERGFKSMFFMGTDVSTGLSDVFSAEHTPRMRVADAVRISMSTPIVFAPVRSALGNVFVDGGILDNYPIKLFDREEYVGPENSLVPDYYERINSQLEEKGRTRSGYVFNKETLGFRLDTREEISKFRDHEIPSPERIRNVFDFARALYRTFRNTQQSVHLHSDDWERTIYIDTLGVGTIDFDLDDAKKEELIKSGYDCTLSYFDWYDSQNKRPLLDSFNFMHNGNKIKAVLFMGALIGGLLALPRIIRALDRRRESREGAGVRPTIMDGEEKKGVCSLDGTPLYVDYLGESDPTVFFAHGYLESGRAFHYQKPYFSDNYRVVSLDFRGFGRSEVPSNKDFSAERLAEDLKAVIDAFNPERFVVAGHSMGGLATFEFFKLFGHEYEGRLKGLAIIDSTGTNTEDLSLRWNMVLKSMANMRPGRFSDTFREYSAHSSFMYLLDRWLVFGRRPPASQVEMLLQSGSSTSFEAACEFPKGTWRFEEHLPDVNVPVMLLVGSEDTLMADDRCNRRTHALLPDSRLKVFEGAGHCSPREQPEAFNEALDGFLTECFS
jgi:NTE family protein